VVWGRVIDDPLEVALYNDKGLKYGNFFRVMPYPAVGQQCPGTGRIASSLVDISEEEESIQIEALSCIILAGRQFIIGPLYFAFQFDTPLGANSTQEFDKTENTGQIALAGGRSSEDADRPTWWSGAGRCYRNYNVTFV